jgi:hypothetical protein
MFPKIQNDIKNPFKIISYSTYIQVDRIYDVLEHLYEEMQQYIT